MATKKVAHRLIRQPMA
jgi:hypothetical protein